MQSDIKLQQIIRYPLKSCRGEVLNRTALTTLGIEADRRLILTETDGRFITARTEPELLRISITQNDEGWVASHPKAGSLAFGNLSDGFGEVQVWGRIIRAPRLRLAEHWFCELLGRQVRLLLNDQSATDEASKRYPWGPIFSDGYPLLICNTASLDALNAVSGGSFEIERFRANLVIETNQPWAEDDWGRIQIGEVILQREKPCERCVLITRDPETLEKHPQQEPLRSLTRLGRKIDGAVLFGQNFSVIRTGEIRAGASVQLLD